MAVYSSVAIASGSPNEAVPQTVFEAIRRGDVTTLLSMLNKAGQINARDGEGNTPLIYAAAYSNLRTVRVLLENGADIHYPDGSGRYPILFCCIGSNVEQLKFLLAKGGGEDINRSPFSILVLVCDHGQASPRGR